MWVFKRNHIFAGCWKTRIPQSGTVAGFHVGATVGRLFGQVLASPLANQQASGAQRCAQQKKDLAQWDGSEAHEMPRGVGLALRTREALDLFQV